MLLQAVRASQAYLGVNLFFGGGIPKMHVLYLLELGLEIVVPHQVGQPHTQHLALILGNYLWLRYQSQVTQQCTAGDLLLLLQRAPLRVVAVMTCHDRTPLENDFVGNCSSACSFPSHPLQFPLCSLSMSRITSCCTVIQGCGQRYPSRSDIIRGKFSYSTMKC